MFARPGASFGVLLVALMLVLLPVESAQAATITVNTTADELNADSDCSFREAILAANTDAPVDGCIAGSGADTISVPAGSYTLSVAGRGEDANVVGDLDIAGDLTIDGAGAFATTIDGADLDRVFHIVIGTVEMSELTIQNGSSVGGLALDSGGGIRNDGTLTLNNSTLKENSTTASGGAIANIGSGGLTLNTSIISRNTAQFRGGGIQNDAPLTVNNSTVSDNTLTASGSRGGGIMNGGMTATLNNSTVSGNTVPLGDSGGIANEGTTVTLNNSTVSGNTARNATGGVGSGGNRILIVNNSTISNNSVSAIGAVGGGINAFDGVTLKNAILGNNSPEDCRGNFTSAGHNLVENNSCGVGGDTTGNIIGSDPLLGPLADNGGPTQTHALLPGSPALNAGSSDCPPPATDQRGVARPQGAACDIGAFERATSSDTTPPTITLTTPPDGAVYRRNQVVHASYACADEAGGEGLATCTGTVANGAAIDTASVGAKTFTVDAQDNAGNMASTTHTYNVVLEVVAFASSRDSNFEIYSMNEDGSSQTRLTANPAADVSPAFSRARTKIAFTSGRTGNGDIYLMNADGSSQTRLTTSAAIDASPALSPDGTRMVFASGRTGNGDVYVMNADGSGQTRLTTNGAVDAEPTWSPDGTKIAFASNRTGNGDVYVMNADGSGQTRRTTSAAIDSSPDWSGDGTKIAFASRRDGNFEVYSMNTDGTGQTRLTTNPAVDGEPAFLATGKIAFASNRGGNLEIYVMNADGSGQTRLTTNPAADTSPDAP